MKFTYSASVKTSDSLTVNQVKVKLGCKLSQCVVKCVLTNLPGFKIYSPYYLTTKFVTIPSFIL